MRRIMFLFTTLASVAILAGCAGHHATSPYAGMPRDHSACSVAWQEKHDQTANRWRAMCVPSFPRGLAWVTESR